MSWFASRGGGGKPKNWSWNWVRSVRVCVQEYSPTTPLHWNTSNYANLRKNNPNKNLKNSRAPARFFFSLSLVKLILQLSKHFSLPIISIKHNVVSSQLLLIVRHDANGDSFQQHRHVTHFSTITFAYEEKQTFVTFSTAPHNSSELSHKRR